MVMNAPRKFNGPSKKLSEFRNCFEAGMDFDTALGCAGLSDIKPEAVDVLRGWWASLEANAS
jgi:hypothetical protein